MIMRIFGQNYMVDSSAWICGNSPFDGDKGIICSGGSAVDTWMRDAFDFASAVSKWTRYAFLIFRL